MKNFGECFKLYAFYPKLFSEVLFWSFVYIYSVNCTFLKLRKSESLIILTYNVDTRLNPKGTDFHGFGTNKVGEILICNKILVRVCVDLTNLHYCILIVFKPVFMPYILILQRLNKCRITRDEWILQLQFQGLQNKSRHLIFHVSTQPKRSQCNPKRRQNRQHP